MPLIFFRNMTLNNWHDIYHMATGQLSCALLFVFGIFLKCCLMNNAVRSVFFHKAFFCTSACFLNDFLEWQIIGQSVSNILKLLICTAEGPIC